jgi:hypothetical protein
VSSSIPESASVADYLALFDVWTKQLKQLHYQLTIIIPLQCGNKETLLVSGRCIASPASLAAPLKDLQ